MAIAKDILVVPTKPEAGTEQEFRTQPPAGDPPLDLGRGLRLEQLPHEEADRYMDACVPRGWNPIPTRQFGQLYSLVRHEAPEPDLPIFDPDETILAAVTLSRLIRPNSLCYEWALRVSEESGRPRLMPLDPGATFLAYVPDRQVRNWLDQVEAEDLRDLLFRYWQYKDEWPERVEHALWLCENASRQQYLDLAWPEVVTGLEALIHTERRDSGRQFVSRVEELASEVNASGVDRAFLDAAWENRSEGVHGSRVPFEDDPEAARKFGRLQRVLQLTIRRAIEDADFREVFSDPSSVHQRWPVC